MGKRTVTTLSLGGIENTMKPDCLPNKSDIRAAIYVRVSTNDQTPENQLLDLKRYCKSREIENYDILEEIESTRKTRPIKEKLLKDTRAGKYNYIVVWQLSRWARSSIELHLEIEELLNRGVVFISIRDLGEINLNTAMGKLIFGVLSSFAEFERDLIRDRTMAGLARAKANGQRLGRPPGAKDLKKRKRRSK